MEKDDTSQAQEKEPELPPAPEDLVTVVDPFEKGNYLLRIAAKPRTGSTLLRVMLAGHPHLFAPPELNLLPFESMGRRGRQIDETGLSWMRYGKLLMKFLIWWSRSEIKRLLTYHSGT